MSFEATRLCSERHYMGSSASGRYVANPDARPGYGAQAGIAVPYHDKAHREAWAARYIKDMGVRDLVLQCELAKALLAQGEEALAERGYEPQDVLSLRRETSRQLRLIGVSPKAQAGIWREMLMRARNAGSKADR